MIAPTDRFSPLPLVRAQWKVLSDYRKPGRPVPDALARVVVFGVPAVVTVVTAVFRVTLASPEAMLSAMALLSGGTLTAFVHLSTVRQRLADIDEQDDDLRFRCDSIDETATHLLADSYAAVVAAVLLVVGMNTTTNASGAITGVMAALISGVSAYVAVVSLMSLPRLYEAYLATMRVRRALSGNVQG